MTKDKTQEPVGIATISFGIFDTNTTLCNFDSKKVPIGTKLYTHPYEWKSLSDDDILNMHLPQKNISDRAIIIISRIMEEALKDINT